MKISFSTLGAPDWSFDRILSESQRLGYDGIEIRGIEGEMRPEKMPQFSAENAKDTLAKLAAHGLVMTNIGTSVSFHDAARYDAAIEEGIAAIDVCAAMGIPAIRVFGDRLPDSDPKTEVMARIGEGFKKLCAYAAPKGVEVWFETHGDFKTVELMEEVIAVTKCEGFGILWDVGHSYLTYGRDFGRFYQTVKPYVRHVHIKDHSPAEGHPLCLIGKGDVPIAEIARQLIKDGYEGFFSLEWEKKWHPELEDADIAIPAYAELMKSIK